MPDRDRNDQGQYADRVDPETVLDVFHDREDTARPVTAGDVVEELGIARRTAHNKLNALVERGVLETRKVGARGRVWWTPQHDTAGATASDDATVDESPTAGETTSTGHDKPTTAAQSRENDAGTRAPATVLDAVDAADADDDTDALPGTVDRDDAAAAVAASRDYIRDHGGATKQDLVKNVMPDHPLGYDVDAALGKIDTDGERFRGAWWRRVVKPVLKALDDVQTPPQGASTWRYTGETLADV